MTKRVCDIYIKKWDDDHGFYVWADSEIISQIKKIEGVTQMYDPLRTGEYSVYLDRRYDVDEIISEIEIMFPVLKVETNRYK